MKFKIILLAVIPFILLGCDDLFDQGDVRKTYDGPDVVGLFPLGPIEVSVASGSRSIEVQLISSSSTQNQNLQIAFSVDGSSTAVEGTHYTIATPSPVTMESGSYTTNITFDLIDGSLGAGESGTILLNLEGAPGVPAEETLARSTLVLRP